MPIWQLPEIRELLSSNVALRSRFCTNLGRNLRIEGPLNSTKIESRLRKVPEVKEGTIVRAADSAKSRPLGRNGGRFIN
jgi:hypothetical protein